jgi:pilus assembly protein CpaB
MNARRLLSALLLALVGSAFFTFWLSKKFSSKPQAEVPHQRQYVALVKATDAGETLQKPALKLVDWPEASPVDGAFAKVDDVAGRTLLYPVSAGEPITEHQLSAPGAAVGLSTHIPDGMRAISLKTDQIVGVAGFLVPGTRVDVLVTYHLQPSNAAVTATVLQDAQIIAAGQKMQPDPDGKAAPVDVVTLLVNPMDAERVVLASAQGSVHFVLRNGNDHMHVAGTSADLSELGEPAQHKPAAVKLTAKGLVNVPTLPPPYVVQTVAGDKQTREIFQ